MNQKTGIMMELKNGSRESISLVEGGMDAILLTKQNKILKISAKI